MIGRLRPEAVRGEEMDRWTNLLAGHLHDELEDVRWYCSLIDHQEFNWGWVDLECLEECGCCLELAIWACSRMSVGRRILQ